MKKGRPEGQGQGGSETWLEEGAAAKLRPLQSAGQPSGPLSEHLSSVAEAKS